MRAASFVGGPTAKNPSGDRAYSAVVARADQERWDERYRVAHAKSGPEAELSQLVPACFAPFVDEFPAEGTSLDLACGAGSASIWLAARGLEVLGCDVSRVAIDLAKARAEQFGVGERCTFVAADLDDGLPAVSPIGFDVVVCHLFRDARLDDAILRSLKPGGLLAIAALSEVGAEPGPFRVRRGALAQAFAELDPIAGDEADGVAWLLCRRVDR